MSGPDSYNRFLVLIEWFLGSLKSEFLFMTVLFLGTQHIRDQSTQGEVWWITCVSVSSLLIVLIKFKIILWLLNWPVSASCCFRLPDGSLMEITKVYPLDAVFDSPEDVPEDVGLTLWWHTSFIYKHTSYNNAWLCR